MSTVKHPETLEEAVDFVIKEVGLEALESFKNSEKTMACILAHFGLGMYIRNNLGLWESGSPLKMALFRSHLCFDADGASGIIAEAVHDTLNDVPLKPSNLLAELRAEQNRKWCKQKPFKLKTLKKR